MNSIIEDGHNTSYISNALMALFHDSSIIEKCMFMNNSSNASNILLCKIVENEFINTLRGKSCVTSKNLNHIRICAYIFGWYNTKNINELMCEYDPTKFIIFVLQHSDYIPLEIKTFDGKNEVINKAFSIQLFPTEKTLQDMINVWCGDNTLINIPQFVVLKINNLKQQLNINKSIRLFSKEHDCHIIEWIFNSMIIYDGNTYHTIINKSLSKNDMENTHLNESLYEFTPNVLPCFKKVGTQMINKFCKITLIYTKEPII